MILAGKAICLLMIFLFTPHILVGAFRGTTVQAGNVFFAAVGATGFVTLQWLL